MTSYLLDTNICIYYLKDTFGIVKKIEKIGLENCYISELTLMELFYGAAKGNLVYRGRNRQNVLLLENHVFKNRILTIRSAFEIYADEKARLKSLGQPIGDIDMLIAASALAHKMILVTHNVKHFERIQELTIEDWVSDN